MPNLSADDTHVSVVEGLLADLPELRGRSGNASMDRTPLTHALAELHRASPRALAPRARPASTLGWDAPVRQEPNRYEVGMD
jgi:hypothetical protein